MASKAGVKKKASKDKARPIAERVAEAALEIAARDGWRGINPATIADEMSEPLGKVIAHYPAPSSVAFLLIRRVDDAVLVAVKGVEEAESPRDRLFEILMMRIDILQASREGYTALAKGLVRHPPNFILAAPTIVHSMALMLIAAGIGATGPGGIVRAHTLALAYASVLRVWIKDETADLGPTMAAMDEALGRLEKLASMSAANGWRGRRDHGVVSADA